ARAVAREERPEGRYPVDLDDLKELLPRVGEVLAEVARQRPPRLRERRVEELLHERCAPAAAARRARTGLHGRHGPDVVVEDRGADGSRGAAVARADERVVPLRDSGWGRGPEKQLVGPRGQRALLAHGREQRGVDARVTDQDAAEEPLA